MITKEQFTKVIEDTLKLNKEYDQNRNMKGCDCCEACVKEA